MQHLNIVDIYLKYRYLSLFFCIVVMLAFVVTPKAYSQNILKANFNFKEGVYRTLEDFKNQTPIIEFEDLHDKYFNRLRKGVCVDLKYFDGKQVHTLNDDEFWGYFMNGELYMRHFEKVGYRSGIYGGEKKCFFKVMKLGPITSYYILYNDEGYHVNNFNPTPPIAYEFAADMVNGFTYSLNMGVGALTKIIKADPYFEKVKINKKNIDMIIYQYNERNPIFEFDGN